MKGYMAVTKNLHYKSEFSVLQLKHVPARASQINTGVISIVTSQTPHTLYSKVSPNPNTEKSLKSMNDQALDYKVLIKRHNRRFVAKCKMQCCLSNMFKTAVFFNYSPFLDVDWATTSLILQNFDLMR